MWDYFVLFLFAGDMAQHETSDRAAKLHASDITYSQGYMAKYD